MMSDHATFLLEALTNGLTKISATLDHLTLDDLLNQFELDLNNWIAVFLFYRDQEAEQISKLRAQHKSLLNSSRVSPGNAKVTTYDDVLLRWGLETLVDAGLIYVQQLLDQMHTDIGNTGLILRTKQHLQIGALNIGVAFADYGDVLQTTIVPTLWPLEIQDDTGIQSTLLSDNDADDGGWVVEWVRENLESKRVEELEALL